jgi:ferric-dicitrate binding protein FerR (iron transport regulator)
VTSRPGQAFEAWRSADTAARAAEQRLQQAWSDYTLGLATPPGNDLIQQVALLRRVAHEKLTSAIAVIGSEAQEQRAGKPGSRSERPSSR